MNRRDFLKSLGLVTTAGLVIPYIPKTLYFDMGKNVIHLPNHGKIVTVSVYQNGSVGEMMVFDPPLRVTQMDKITFYLSQKYGPQVKIEKNVC